jgi:hypothetical protein
MWVRRGQPCRRSRHVRLQQAVNLSPVARAECAPHEQAFLNQPLHSLAIGGENVIPTGKDIGIGQAKRSDLMKDTYIRECLDIAQERLEFRQA